MKALTDRCGRCGTMGIISMRRTLAGIFILLWIGLSTGCMGDVVEVTVVLKNATDFELKWVVFDIPQSSGTYSPMHNIVTTEDDALKPGEEREVVISFVESDFGNSGCALIDLEEDGSSDAMEAAQGEVILNRGTNRFEITHDGEAFAIMAGETKSI